MYYFFVAKCGKDHDKFKKLSWYEIGLYIDQYREQEERRLHDEEGRWARFRIQWADFRNANRGKNGRVVHGKDLIRLSIDDRVPEYHEIDIDAIKRRLGSKIKKRGK